MMYPRFRVATVTGYPITLPVPEKSGWRKEPGVSATVCDTAYNWREIATYRSEDRMKGTRGGAVRGVAQTIRVAQDHADRLNAIEARRLATERERRRRNGARADG